MDAAAIARADAELERRLNEMPSPTGWTQRLPLRLDRMPHHLRDQILADRERRRRREEEERERKRAARKQKEREERRERKRERRERRERERREREPDDELEEGELRDELEDGEVRDEPPPDDQKANKPKPDRKKKKKKKSKHRDCEREEAGEPKDGDEHREPAAKRKKKKKKRKDREKADGDEPEILEQKSEPKKKRKKPKEPKEPKKAKKPAEPEDTDKPTTSASTSTVKKPPKLKAKPTAMLMTSTPKASRKPAAPKKPLAGKKPPVKPLNRRDPRHPLNQKKKPKKRLDHEELRAARRAMRHRPRPDIAQILRLPAPLHQPLMEAMEEVRHHREIPPDERRMIRGFLNFKGDLIAKLSEYREMEIDTTLTNHQLDKKFEMMERHRAKLQQKLRDVCKWLRQRVEFQDGEEPEDSTDDEGEPKPKPEKVFVTCTSCEHLNDLLTKFVNDEANRDDDYVLLEPKHLKRMIAELTDDEKARLVPAGEVLDDEFIITMTADIKRHVRGARYEQWADVALLNGKTDAEHEAADRTPGLFGGARPGADEEFERLRARTIETLQQLNAEAEAEQDGAGLSIDDIRDGMIALDESEGEDNDSELTTASSDIVTINSTTDDEDQLLRNVTAAIEQTTDDVVEVNEEDEGEEENGEAEVEVEAGEAEEVEAVEAAARSPSTVAAPSTSTSAAPAPSDDSPRPPAVVIASGRESQRQLCAQLADRKRQSGGEEDGGVGNDVVPPDPFPASGPNATADSQLSRRSANSSDISLAGSDGAPPFKRSRSRMPEESEEEAGIDDQLPLLADDQPAAAPLDDSVEIIEIDDDSDSDIVCLN
ncbi:hypothetical protein M3Y99_00483500 [Aphelenchoides fujianensis]|nr:hypothetical protein M3Y99_00483500 [Aphelenchoides fujianensis]